MKLVMDEKLKHRLIGLAVIISLGAIFAPAVMKKSSQHVDGSFSVNVKLPPKPIAPDVVMTDEKDMFKTIKIAKVEIPPVSGDKQLSALVKAEPISSDLTQDNAGTEIAKNNPDKKSNTALSPAQLALNKAAQSTAKKVVTLAVAKRSKTAPAIAANQKVITKATRVASTVKVNKAVQIARATPKNASKASARKEIYAVQLASFSQLTNAQALVNRLHGKGYKANYIKSPGRNGTVYKVYVGHSQRKLEVIKLKSQLASAMQLNGFVVNTGVS